MFLRYSAPWHQPTWTRSTVPEVETIPGESSGVAPVKIGGSPPPSLSPMTPEEKTEERLEGEAVVKEPAKKKTRLQYEVSGLADRVDKACETMNGLSSAMTKMCEAFQAECSDLQQGLKAMGLQGISNKGMLAAMVTYENTLRDILTQPLASMAKPVIFLFCFVESLNVLGQISQSIRLIPMKDSQIPKFPASVTGESPEHLRKKS